MDGCGRLASISEMPITIDFWTAWTASLLLRKGNYIEQHTCVAACMRVVHSRQRWSDVAIGGDGERGEIEKVQQQKGLRLHSADVTR